MMFEVDSGGVTYEVEAPDQETAIRALQELMRDAPENVAPPEPAKSEPYSGSILPFSKDAEGNVSFDSNAGIVGAFKRAVTLPNEVMKGEVDPASDEGIGRALEMGAFFTPANPAVRAGERAIAGSAKAFKPGKRPIPTSEQLKAAGSAGYDRVRNMGVDYRSDAVRDLAMTVRTKLEGDGVLAELAPKSFAILKKLETPPEGSVATSAGIEAARRALRNAAKDFTNPTEQLAAKRIMDGLDEFVRVGDPASVVAGPAAAAGKLQGEARANYAAGKRSDRLTGIEETAELRAGAANSGRNLDNSIRQRVASVLSDPKKRAGFSEEEIALLTKVAKGGATRNLIRQAGNLLGGGGGLGMYITGASGGLAGGALGGPVGAAIGLGLPAVGAGAKAGANRLTARALRQADEAVRKRSPLYEQTPTPMVPRNPLVPSLPGRALGGAAVRPPMTGREYEEFLRSGGT